MNADGRIYGTGVYPLRVAAAYAHLPPRTVHRWIEGYDYKHKGEHRRSAPIASLARPESDEDRVLDFEQLLTLLLVKAFKDRGLGLPTIKKAAAKAQTAYHVPNPFVTKQFRSDGNSVFIDLEAPGRERAMINVLTDQHQFGRSLSPACSRAWCSPTTRRPNGGPWARITESSWLRAASSGHRTLTAGPPGLTSSLRRSRPRAATRRPKKPSPTGTVWIRRGAGCRHVRGAMAAAEDGGLTFVLDHNFRQSVLDILRWSKVRPEGRITSLAEMGIAGETADEVWIPLLASKGKCVAVTRDGEILNAAVRRRAWKQAGVSLLLLDRSGGLPLRELARTLLFWWPHMVEYAQAGQPGTAWTVSHKVPDAPEKGIRLVTGPGA